jgi:hypothetical protein
MLSYTIYYLEGEANHSGKHVMKDEATAVVLKNTTATFSHKLPKFLLWLFYNRHHSSYITGQYTTVGILNSVCSSII